MQGSPPCTAGRLVPLVHACRQRAQRAGLMDATLLSDARSEYERPLALAREELGVDRDEFADSTTRWSRCRDDSGESATLASGGGSARWSPPRRSWRHRLRRAVLPRSVAVGETDEAL